MSPNQGYNKNGARRRAVLVFLTPYFSVLILAFTYFALLGVQNAKAIDVSTNLIISICGDAIVNAGETCDDGVGNNTGAYASSTAERTCSPDCFSFGPYCGDSTLQARFEEECDDGNNTSGDVCSASCKTETVSPPGSGGPPTRGGVPSAPGGLQGNIPSESETKVVLRGKAYPNRRVNILLDGEVIGTVQADSNADFIFSTTEITPGVATFGFWATDIHETKSIITSMVFEVAQSAVTTLANVFIPPTTVASARQIPHGEPLTISGQSVPLAKVVTEVNHGDEVTISSDTDESGVWALQLDTASLSEGFHTAKSHFELPDGERSGFGRSVSFYIGEGLPIGDVSADTNGDKRVNLIDFSIFLVNWGTDDIRHDFNLDGTVNLADFSIMLFNWTG